jgi:predicted TIM-barrel fold metal-dependent hydrolase
VIVADAHTHVVSPDPARHPFDPPGLPGDHWFVRHPVSAEDLRARMDAAGVHAAILVQPMGAYRYDNRYAAEAAAADARFGAACIVDATAPDRGDRLAMWLGELGMGGVRLFDIPPADPPWLDAPGVDDLLQVALAYDARVAVCTQPAGLDGLERVLAAHPHLPVVLDHCGFVDVHGRAPYAGTERLRRLAEHPGLVAKVTSHLLAEPDDPRELVEHLVGLFGADRVVWGSDYAQTHDRPYEDLVALGHHACSGLDPSDHALVMGGTLLRLWPELAPPPPPPSALA